jgi:hypothetical protein
MDKFSRGSQGHGHCSFIRVALFKCIVGPCGYFRFQEYLVPARKPVALSYAISIMTL